MDEIEESKEYSYTPGRSLEAASMRICIICHDQITATELKKSMASWIPAGSGLRFSVHNACLSEVERAIDEQREQEQQAEEATQFVRDLAKTAQQAVRKHR